MSETIITKLSWGQIEITTDEQIHQFKDCKIWPGGAREWNWKETGTEHNPGIQPADIEEILEHDVEVVILSRGMLSRLGVCAETENLLRNRNITYHIEETKRAADLFNNLANQGTCVGGVFHTTC